MLNTQPRPERLLVAWRERRDGFAPLFLEPVMVHALAHLEGALHPDALVLDLGSGGGHVADAVRACGARTVCLDVDGVVLASSRRRYPGGAHVASDAARLPLPDRSVDAVFCFSVLQYTDRDAALAEIRRVLKSDGRVVVVENLAGSLLAQAYRAWRRIARIRYPKRLTPVRHVAWAERSRFLVPFPGAQLDAYFLFSTWLLLLPPVYRADAGEEPRSFLRALLVFFRRLDAWLFRVFPRLRHGAWILLVRG